MRSMITAEPAMNDARNATTAREQPARAPHSDRRTRRDGAVVRRVSMAACLFVAACGGSEDSSDPEPTAWKDMAFEERVSYMNSAVLPRMKEVFVAYDPKFEAMDCATCHGADGPTRAYAMPSPAIAMLPDTEEGFLAYVQDPEHPERADWSAFMLEQVLPEMANLLQRDPYDPTTGAGDFSCNNCHTLGSVEP